MGILYTPFGWILRILYDLSGNYFVALLILTILTKLILLPSSISQQKGTAKQQRLQPKLKHIQEKYAGNRQKIQEETTALYQREGYSAMTSGCLPLFIQFPIIIGLYGVIYQPLKYVLRISSTALTSLEKAYALVIGAADKVNTRQVELSLLGRFDEVVAKVNEVVASGSTTEGITAVSSDVIARIRDFANEFSIFGVSLGKIPPSFKAFGSAATSEKLLILIPILAMVAQLLSSLFMFLRQRKTNPDMAKNPASGCMMFGMPLFSFFLAMKFPIGIGIYWILQSVLAFIQTVILSYVYEPKKVIAREMVKETIEHRAKEKMMKMARENRSNVS